MNLVIDPLYDKNAYFVGWLVDHAHVFNVNLQWVAYIFNDYVWSIKTKRWIGELRGTNLLDRDGKVVAWSTSGPVIGNLDPIDAPIDIRPPIPPIAPIIDDIPLSPGYAPDPIGEWSSLSFNQWLNQR